MNEKSMGAGTMAQWLTALAALPEELSSIPSNHMIPSHQCTQNKIKNSEQSTVIKVHLAQDSYSRKKNMPYFIVSDVSVTFFFLLDFPFPLQKLLSVSTMQNLLHLAMMLFLMSLL